MTHKLHTLAPALALALTTIIYQPSNSFAQGSLTPPAGSPAPVMKTLDQIEARTPLVAGQPGVSVAVSGTITITNSGSYYLTQNLVISNVNTTAIDLSTNNVTLDLNGFSILNTNTASSNVSCIRIYGGPGQNVTIRNGIIRGGGTTTVSGITVYQGSFGGTVVEDVHCYNLYGGIRLNSYGTRNIARNCSVQSIGDVGIDADVVIGCTAISTGDHAIWAHVVSDSRGHSTGSGNGIMGRDVSGFQESVVNNSSGRSSGGYGIYANSVANSYGYSGAGIGLRALTANNCSAYRFQGTAIQATIANGCIAVQGTNNITHKYNMP